MDDKELDIRLMELCKKELETLDTDKNYLSAEILKCYIKRWKRIISGYGPVW